MLTDNRIERVEAIDVQELWKAKNTADTSNTLLLITTHNLKPPQVYNIIHQNIPLLRQDPRINMYSKYTKWLKAKDNKKP